MTVRELLNALMILPEDQLDFIVNVPEPANDYNFTSRPIASISVLVATDDPLVGHLALLPARPLVFNKPAIKFTCETKVL